TDPEPASSEGTVSASAAAKLVLEEISDITATFPDGSGSADEDAIVAPPGLMELRPGAPGSMPVGLLFVVEPPDTAGLGPGVGGCEEPGGLPDRYQDVLGLAAARLAPAPSGSSSAAAAAPAAFVSYDVESLPDECF